MRLWPTPAWASWARSLQAAEAGKEMGRPGKADPGSREEAVAWVVEAGEEVPVRAVRAKAAEPADGGRIRAAAAWAVAAGEEWVRNPSKDGGKMPGILLLCCKMVRRAQ